MKKPEIYLRKRGTITAILACIDGRLDGVPWNEVINAGSATDGDELTPSATVERAMRAIIEFGAARIIGKFDRRHGDTRRLVLTTLGVAWLDQELMPLHDDDTHDWTSWLDAED